jgi:dihydrolipoamide dehydrogenase
MSYDIVIIGSGPAGYVAAIRAAQLGLGCAVVEKANIGGTCLNIGCIPTKTLLRGAEVVHDLREGSRRGITAEGIQVDMPKMVKHKDGIVRQLTSGVAGLLKARGVDVYQGDAEAVSAHEVKVGEETLECKNLIIATGSSNAIPPVPGLGSDGILTSTEALSLDHVPESMCVIGGGVIGCELATVYAELGCKVTIVEMMDRILPTIDADLAEVCAGGLKKAKAKVHTSASVCGVTKTDAGWNVSFRPMADKEAEPSVVSVEQVLVSTGRKPNLEGISSLGLDADRKGYLAVDEHMRTSEEGVYAIGDITGTIQLAHVAMRQGIVAVESIAGLGSTMSYDCVPSCVYVIPELASVGLTPAKAEEQGIKVTLGSFPMGGNGRAKAIGQTTGFTRIVAEAETGRVLGGQIAGPGATEMIGEVALAVQNGLTLEDIAATIHAHPTVSETIYEAALAGLGRPLHML